MTKCAARRSGRENPSFISFRRRVASYRGAEKFEKMPLEILLEAGVVSKTSLYRGDTFSSFALQRCHHSLFLTFLPDLCFQHQSGNVGILKRVRQALFTSSCVTAENPQTEILSHLFAEVSYPWHYISQASSLHQCRPIFSH